MREDQSELMLAQARSDLAGGANRAKGRDAKNTRDLDAEMRKRRLAKNALLAVRNPGVLTAQTAEVHSCGAVHTVPSTRT